MTDSIEHRGVSRKTFLIYLLQLSFIAGIAKYLYGFESKQHYLLNKFSVAGFYFYDGLTEIYDKRIFDEKRSTIYDYVYECM